MGVHVHKCPGCRTNFVCQCHKQKDAPEKLCNGCKADRRKK